MYTHKHHVACLHEIIIKTEKLIQKKSCLARILTNHACLALQNEKKKRNSSVCEVENSDNFELLFAVCTINKNWYAIGDVLEKTQESILDCGDNFPCAHQQIKNFIYKVKMSLTKKMIAIPVGSIVRICVHIAVKYSPIDYIILQPNKNMNTIDHCIYSLYSSICACGL